MTLLCPDLRWSAPSGKWKRLSSKLELPSFKVSTAGKWEHKSRSWSSKTKLEVKISLLQQLAKCDHL